MKARHRLTSVLIIIVLLAFSTSALCQAASEPAGALAPKSEVKNVIDFNILFTLFYLFDGYYGLAVEYQRSFNKLMGLSVSSTLAYFDGSIQGFTDWGIEAWHWTLDVGPRFSVLKKGLRGFYITPRVGFHYLTGTNALAFQAKIQEEHAYAFMIGGQAEIGYQILFPAQKLALTFGGAPLYYQTVSYDHNDPRDRKDMKDMGGFGLLFNISLGPAW